MSKAIPDEVQKQIDKMTEQQFPLWGKVKTSEVSIDYLASKIAFKDFRSLALHYKPGVAARQATIVVSTRFVAYKPVR